MTHVRKQIRDAVKTLMTTRASGSSAYPTVAEERWYTRGAQKQREGQCPFARVMTPSESNERLDYEDDRKRTIRLELELNLFKTGGVGEDDIDAFCAEVEILMDTGLSPAFDVEYVGTDFDYPQEGAEEFAVATIAYEVTAITALGAPGTSVKN